MASVGWGHAGEAGGRPSLVQELGFTLAEIEALLDGVLAREGWSHVKERALPGGLRYRVQSAIDGGEVLLRFTSLPDRTFAGGRMRFPRTRFTGTFRDASATFVEGWLRRLQHTFLKGGG